MAISVLSSEIQNGISCRFSPDGNSYRATYRVKVDGVTGGNVVILKASQSGVTPHKVPKEGDTINISLSGERTRDTTVAATEFEADIVDSKDRLTWDVTVSWTTPGAPNNAQEGASPEDKLEPFSRNDRVTSDFITQQIPRQFGRNIDAIRWAYFKDRAAGTFGPITNNAGFPPDEVFTDEIRHDVIVYTKNVKNPLAHIPINRAFGPQLGGATPLNGTSNNGSWQVFGLNRKRNIVPAGVVTQVAKGLAKFLYARTVGPFYFDEEPYYELETRVAINQFPWLTVVPNVGDKFWDRTGLKLNYVLDDQGAIARGAKVPLTGGVAATGGQRFTGGTAQIRREALLFETLEPKDYSLLTTAIDSAK